MSAQVRSRDKKYIPASKVWRDRYGVSPMTGWRWEHDGTLGFPKPYYMGRFKYSPRTSSKPGSGACPASSGRTGDAIMTFMCSAAPDGDIVAIPSVSAPVAFPTGWGQTDTHAITLSSGKPNQSPKAGTAYRTINFDDIARLAQKPQAVPKERAQWFLPSTYREFDARTHEVQGALGRFRLLVLDVDENDLDLEDIQQALEAVVGQAAYLIYATRSSTPGDRKWRALVYLDCELAGVHYVDTQNSFFELLEEMSQGVLIPDRRLAMPGQLVYLPNRGEIYEFVIKQDWPPLSLAPDHPIVQRREATRAARAEAEREAVERRAAKRTQRTAAADEAKVLPADDFNEWHSVTDLLGKYGYTRAGGSEHWRSPYQKSGSYATMDCGDHWTSLSGSDADAGIGTATRSGYRWGDAFDLFVHFEHDGRFDAAVRAYAEMPDLGGRPAASVERRPRSGRTGVPTAASGQGGRRRRR